MAGQAQTSEKVLEQKSSYREFLGLRLCPACRQGRDVEVAGGGDLLLWILRNTLFTR